MTACYDGAAMADPHPSGRVSQPGPRDPDRPAAGNAVLAGLLLVAAILLELVALSWRESAPVPPLLRAYIGPGAGIALLGSFFAVFAAFLSAVFFIISWPIRST